MYLSHTRLVPLKLILLGSPTFEKRLESPKHLPTDLTRQPKRTKGVKTSLTQQNQSSVRKMSDIAQNRKTGLPNFSLPPLYSLLTSCVVIMHHEHAWRNCICQSCYRSAGCGCLDCDKARRCCVVTSICCCSFRHSCFVATSSSKLCRLPLCVPKALCFLNAVSLLCPVCVLFRAVSTSCSCEYFAPTSTAIDPIPCITAGATVLVHGSSS